MVFSGVQPAAARRCPPAGQLLGSTIQHEQPEIETQRSALLRQEESLKVQLAALEKQLLQTLANSKGNILDNKELLTSLDETKTKSTTIAASLKESEELQASLNEKRNVYRCVRDPTKLRPWMNAPALLFYQLIVGFHAFWDAINACI